MQAVKEQILASDPNSSIWLSANAGTGKTHVLINRILRLLLEGNEPEKIICITYTTAAAVEMQNRIIDISRKWITKSDNEITDELASIIGDNTPINDGKIENLRKNLGLILDFPEKLKIQTIHSFCQSILKNFPIEAQVTPFFDVMDEIEKKKIVDKCFNILFSKTQKHDSYSPVKEHIDQLLTKVSTYTLKDTLTEFIENRVKVRKVLEKYSNTDGYIDFLKQHLAIETTNEAELIEDFRVKNKNFISSYLESLKLATIKYVPIKNNLEIFIRTGDFSYLNDALKTADNKIRKDFINKKIIENSPNLNDHISKLIDNFIRLDNQLKSINILKCTKLFLTIFEELIEEYQQLKKQKGVLDYDDLIEKTFLLFLNKQNHLRDWILYKLDGGIDHILLDEAQDTNPEQWEVIKAITEEFFSGADGERNKKRTLFVVGDEKQSIYSFQGADFRVFNKMRDYFNSKANNSSNHNFSEIPLNISFRSCPAILKLVDDVLTNEKVKSNVTLKEDNITNHEAFRKEHFGYFEISPLIGEKPSRKPKSRISWTLPKEYPVDVEENNKSLLAKEVAAKIRELIDSKRILPSTGKPVEHKDIMILLRKRANIFSKLINELDKLNIPVSGVDRLDLKENMAIKDLISYAKFKLQPYDDLNLACLLKSPFFEISEQGLFDICWNRKNLSVFENLKEKSSDNTDSPAILDELNSVLNSKSNENPTEFFLDILERNNNKVRFTNYYGFQIYEIFDEFLSMLNKYQISNLPSLQQFINWFENSETEIKRNQETNKDAVKIITIHGSKGLQAPIVILPHTTYDNKKGKKNIINDNFIICLDSKSSKNEIFDLHENAIKDIENAENKRLLYVAITRAKDEMYIFGDRSDDFEKPDCWYNIIRESAERICTINDNEKLILTNDEYLSFTKSSSDTQEKNNKKIEKNNFPEFLFEKPKEQQKLEFIRPSEILKNNKKIEKNNKINNNYYTSKGTFIHKLLEVLPTLKKEQWTDCINLISQDHDFTQSDIDKFTSEAINVIENPELNFIFNNESLSEIPVSQIKNGSQIITGQIDKLVKLNESELLIIDYKTTELNAEELDTEALKYKEQLNSYKSILQNIYPEKIIRTAILFTHANKLIQVDVND